MKLFKYRHVAGLLALATALTLAATAGAAQAPVPLGDAASFGALSATAMTNAGANTVVTGNIGSSTSIDVGVTNPGFGRYGAGAPELTNAQASLLTAYGNAEARTPTGNITGMNLAGQTFTDGVYNSTGGILISGPTPLTLDGGGNADSVFIFQAAAAGDLTVAATSNIVFTNSAQPCNVFWKVQSAFLQNTGFTFVGTILALTQITLTNNINVQGRVFARNADVTFIGDTVTRPSSCITQASVNAAAAAATTAATQAAAAAAAAAAAEKAADDAADAARDAAAAAATAEAARVAAAAAAAAAAAEAARVEAEKAAAAKVVAETAAAAAAAAARAANAAKVAQAVQTAKAAAAKAKTAAAKAKAARVAAVKAAVKAKVALAKAKKAAAAGASTSVAGPALPPVNAAGFTG